MTLLLRSPYSHAKVSIRLLAALFLILFLSTACTTGSSFLPSKQVSKSNDLLKKNPKKRVTQLKPSDYHQHCQFIFENKKKPITEDMVQSCLINTLPKYHSQLIDHLLAYKPMPTKKPLGVVLAFVSAQKETVEDSRLVKKLLDAGAPSNNLSINNMLVSQANACESVTLIIKNNLKVHQDAQPDYLPMLTSINRGYASCPKSIRLLVADYPKLLNDQDSYGMTPLHHYLVGVDHPNWDLNIAKLLMTKENIKLKDKKGYTPQHYIQLLTHKNKAVYQGLISASEHFSKVDKVVLEKSTDSLLLKNRPNCRSIINTPFNKKPLNPKKIIDCFSDYVELETPYLVDKLLEHKPAVSKKTLSDLVIILANDMTNAVHTNSIEKLIKAGASTENVAAPMIIYGGDFSCNTLMLVLKHNSHLYNDPQFLNTATQAEHNNTSPRSQDLHALSAVGLERGICYDAIRYLANTHPQLRDVQEKYSHSTPLHIFLGDTHWDGWNLETAKALMSKNNINLQDKYGNTPLHSLNSGAESNEITTHEILIIKTMIEHGADITLKNKKGISPQQMFEKKNPKLKTLFLKLKNRHLR